MEYSPLFVTLMGIGTVFFGLICIIFLTMAMGAVLKGKEKTPAVAAAAPAAAAVLPQTGANWLAVVGSALSGLFLLAAGFVLDRKNRRMN